MRARAGVWLVVALAVAVPAQAQEHARPDATPAAENRCLDGHPGAEGQRFCSCWIRRWVELWNDEDRSAWSKTGTATPHIEAMGKVAVNQCNAWHHEIDP